MVRSSGWHIKGQQSGRWHLPPAVLFTIVLALLGMLVQHNSQKLAVVLSKLSKQVRGREPASAVRPSAFCALERPPYVCAHGGDSAQYPPNTAAAYAAAIAAGVDCIELDVSLTADQQLVTLHNKHLQQLLRNSTARAHDFTLKQLLSTSWPGGESMQTVAEALKMTAPKVELVILDVKLTEPDNAHSPEASILVDLLLQLLDKAGYNNTLIWGKLDTISQLVKQSAPSQRTGYTVMFDHSGTAPHFEVPLRRPMRDMEVAAVYHGMLNHSLMDELQSAGKLIIVWSVNEPSEMTRMLDLNVHGIVTDNPGLLLAAIKDRWSSCPVVT